MKWFEVGILEIESFLAHLVLQEPYKTIGLHEMKMQEKVKTPNKCYPICDSQVLFPINLQIWTSQMVKKCTLNSYWAYNVL